MKALTLTQPWASLVAGGHKTLETRSWSTNYRGPLAIHAAKGFPATARIFSRSPRFQHVLPSTLPFGAVVATCRLADCLPTAASVAAFGYEMAERAIRERALGDYSAGRFVWVLEDVQRVDPPVPVGGHLGLWDLPVEVEGEVMGYDWPADTLESLGVEV